MILLVAKLFAPFVMTQLREVRDRSVAEEQYSTALGTIVLSIVCFWPDRWSGFPAGGVETKGRRKSGSMSSFSRAPQQWATFARMWYLLDGRMQPPGKLAAIASQRLQGLHKPVYHQLSDCGDHVVIINTRHIAFSGNKWEQKVYSSHTGYPGGFRQVTAAQLHLKDPVAIVKLATYGMLPKNLHRRTMMQRLHLFPDEDIPEDILKNLVEELPRPRTVPKRLDEYTQEEMEAFPRVWAPPEDYRL